MAKRKRTPGAANLNPGFILDQEAMMQAMQKTLKDMKFDTPEEAEAFLNQFVGMRMEEVTQALGEGPDSSIEGQADGMFFEAMTSSTRFAAKRKLAAVLKLDPDHVRAQTALATMESSLPKAELALRNAIAAGERKLGPLLQEARGELWGYLEARPYMEAREELARLLAGQEKRIDDAIAEQQEMLRLNENDNQGMRDPLLALLLEMRRFDEARALIKKYETDHTATWMYGKALLAFEEHATAAKWDISQYDQQWMEQQMKAMVDGNLPTIPKAVRKADKVLIKAFEFNPWCAIYLLNAAEYSQDELPESYSPGSEEEARLFLKHQSTAWGSNPAALLWFMVNAMPWLVKNGYDDELRGTLE
jgi:tetratricopeptide (TPR) repeat protein